MNNIIKKILVSALSFGLVLSTGAPVFAEGEAVKAVNPDNLKLFDREDSPEYRPNEAVVLMKDDLSSKAVRSELKSVERSVDVNTTLDVYGQNLTVAVVESDLSTEKLISKLEKDDDVLIAEPNYIYHAMETTSDTYAAHQWGYDAGSIDVERGKGYTGAEKVVAVVDSGIDYTNEDLKDMMWTNKLYPKLKGTHGFDFVNLDNSPLDDNGHGSHCAGIIAAERDNNAGIKGISDVKLMAIKVLDADGSGDLEGIINGYNYILKAQSLGVNVVAVNNSWGGEGDSKILTELIDMLGENGAASICAAGNEAADNDVEECYPACCDSDYVISVASTDCTGKLASYSNYGNESVDVAAPGTNILSTVSYDCFNPSLYDGEKRDALVEKYYDLSGELDPEIEVSAFDENAEDIEGSYTLSAADGLNGTGSATKISFKQKAGDLCMIKVPYTSGNENCIHLSAIAQITTKSDFEAFYYVADMSRSDSNEKIYEDLEYHANKDTAVAEFLGPEDECWDHIDYAEDEPLGEDRYMLIAVYCMNGGEYSVTLDNLGLSKDVEASSFGKYDYMSGTSMACPYVTGAYALKADEVNDDVRENKAALLSNVNSDKELEVITRGAVDFAIESSTPHVRNAVIEGKNIRINGFGLKDADISIDGEAAEILEAKNSSLVIENNNWTNKIITVDASNESGADSKEIYLVKGKKAFKEIPSIFNDDEDFEDFGGSSGDAAYTSSAKYVYQLEDGSINRAGISSIVNAEATEDIPWREIAEIDESYFEEESNPNKNARYGVVVSDSIAYMNGRIYLIAGYGQIASAEIVIGETDLGGGWIYEETEEREVLYSGEYKLLSVNVSSGKVKVEKTLPAGVEQREGMALAAYNGKLYVIGGYDYQDGNETLSAAVDVYDPASRKWTKKANIPVAGADGQAVQCGDKLAYMSRVSESETPELYILSGSRWQTQEIAALCEPTTIKTEQGKYSRFSFALGNCKAAGKPAVVITGIPTEYGDTFTYNLSSKKFSDTGYQYTSGLEYSDVSGVAVGSNLLVSDSVGNLSYAKISSGLVKVTSSKKGSGSITKTSYYVPGSKATFTAKAKKGYYLASISVNGKVKKYTKKTRTKTIVVSSAITSNKTVKAVFKKR